MVSMIWQYLKLPEESRKRVKADLIDVHENCGKEDFKIPDLYDIVPKEEIAEFEDIMRKIITGIISEASGIATWVYVQKYEKRSICICDTAPLFCNAYRKIYDAA